MKIKPKNAKNKTKEKTKQENNRVQHTCELRERKTDCLRDAFAPPFLFVPIFGLPVPSDERTAFGSKNRPQLFVFLTR